MPAHWQEAHGGFVAKRKKSARLCKPCPPDCAKSGRNWQGIGGQMFGHTMGDDGYIYTAFACSRRQPLTKCTGDFRRRFLFCLNKAIGVPSFFRQDRAANGKSLNKPNGKAFRLVCLSSAGDNRQQRGERADGIGAVRVGVPLRRVKQTGVDAAEPSAENVGGGAVAADQQTGAFRPHLL